MEANGAANLVNGRLMILAVIKQLGYHNDANGSCNLISLESLLGLNGEEVRSVISL